MGLKPHYFPTPAQTVLIAVEKLKQRDSWLHAQGYAWPLPQSSHCREEGWAVPTLSG